MQEVYRAFPHILERLQCTYQAAYVLLKTLPGWVALLYLHSLGVVADIHN